MRTCALALLFALGSGGVMAAEMTADQLAAKCRSESVSHLAICDLYLEAVLGASRAVGAEFDDYYAANFRKILGELDSDESRKAFRSLSWKVCIRPDEPIETVRVAFLGYLNRHPKESAESAYWAVTRTLSERWGCRVVF